MIYDNRGDEFAPEQGVFIEQYKEAYRELNAVVDRLGKELPGGAIILALTQLQFEVSTQMTLAAVQSMLSE